MQRWDQVRDFLIDQATADLQQADGVHPCLAAFRGDEPLAAVFLRPFERGAYRDPVVEVLGLALALRADRLALSVAGRAWSLDDPVVPVLPDADLRQTVLVIEQADGHRRDPPRCRSVLVPYTVRGGRVTWDSAVDPGVADGWIPAALRAAAGVTDRTPARRAQVRAQAERCVDLGHVVALAPQVAALVTAGRLRPL